MSGLKKNQWGLTNPKMKNIFSYNWTINNYSYLDKQEEIDSPLFSINSGEKKWILSLIPKSLDDENYVEFGLYWDWKENEEENRAENTFEGWCYVSVLNNKGEKYEEEATMIKNDFKRWCPLLILRNDLWNKDNNLLPNNSLTIRCEFITGEVECAVLSSEDNNQCEISLEEVREEPKGIEKLFLDEHLSDVKLIASCGQSLPAHRSILAAFSPVFQAMFVNDMRERAEGEVKVEDGKYEVLKEMLRFIYTGKVENFAPNASELISLADKYQISELRALCESELNKTMSADNVLDILAIAHQHNIEHLVNEATNFIKAYHRVIVNSEAFKSLSNVQVLKTVSEAMSQMYNLI